MAMLTCEVYIHLVANDGYLLKEVPIDNVPIGRNKNRVKKPMRYVAC